jgi:ubiquinone biosynthesis protein
MQAECRARYRIAPSQDDGLEVLLRSARGETLTGTVTDLSVAGIGAWLDGPALSVGERASLHFPWPKPATGIELTAKVVFRVDGESQMRYGLQFDQPPSPNSPIEETIFRLFNRRRVRRVETQLASPSGSAQEAAREQRTAQRSDSAWVVLAAGIDTSTLVPECYAAYRPLIADGLRFFVERLPVARLGRLVADQQALPAGTDMAHRLATLIGGCPTLHKLGQIVARNHHLAPALRAHLQRLESMAPTQAVASLVPGLRTELGEQALQAISLAPVALAQASVAVVVPFTLPGANAVAPEQGVLKILKPGIEDCLAEELEIWSALGPYLDQRCEDHGLPSLNYAETLAAVSELLANEVHLDREQRHLVLAARLYEHVHAVKIPRLFDFSTSRVTAMERVFGTKVTDTAHIAEADRWALAVSIVEALIAQPMWSRQPNALFHADPHAGNLIATDDGRVAILDWSLVGYLAKSEREKIIKLMAAALRFDADEMAHAIAGLARTVRNPVALRKAVDRALAKLLPARLPGFGWLIRLLDDVTILSGASFGEQMTLFRKSILTLEDVLADVCAGSSLDKILPRSALDQLLREWSQRAFASPASREFGTHLSNLDLLSIYWSLPVASAKRLAALCSQWLSPSK